MDVQQGLAIGAWHERGEAAIRASRIPFTFIQPTGFMSNLLAWAPSIRAEGIVRASTGNGRRAFIHSDDIAAVAAEALTTSGFEGESIAFTGPEALSFAEVTEKIGIAIGKQLTFNRSTTKKRASDICESADQQKKRRLMFRYGVPFAKAVWGLSPTMSNAVSAANQSVWINS